MILMNLLFDVVRYVYGRGVLFKLSSLSVFFLILGKDFFYQMWHFGFKYSDWILAFQIKIFHPGNLLSNSKIPKLYKWTARIVSGYANAAEPFKWITRIWEPVCDYTKITIPEIEDEEEATPKATVKCSHNVVLCAYIWLFFRKCDFAGLFCVPL